MAIDLIRGFFLLVIMVDHVELYPSGWDFLTGRGRLWVSAAEGFFFLSGLLIGMIYKRRMNLGVKFLFRKMWARALELYVVGTGLTLVFLGWVELTNHAPIKDYLPHPFPWHDYLKQLLLTRFTYGWADFLVHFAVLMVFAPLVFWLVSKGKWWLVLGATAAVWFFRGESFNMAWQLIFNLGIIIGFHWQAITGWFRKYKHRHPNIKKTIAWSAGVTFLASYLSVFLLNLLYYIWGRGSMPHWGYHPVYTWGRLNYDAWVYADKWTLGPLRVGLFLLWFTVLFWLFNKYQLAINKFTRGWLELLGRNSLFVYTAHAVIVFILKMYLIPARTGFWLNFLFTAVALASLIAVTLGYKKIETKYSLRRHRAH